jgi:cob(I)alamin adenosyltransferase
MKIYTGSGDRGKTSLFSGERVSKSDLRVEAYGDVDELNSILGGLVAALPSTQAELAEEIKEIQSVLLHIGARLAIKPGSPVSAELEEITAEHSKGLEGAIDRIDDSLPTLKDFILPGGHISAAWAHLARTVCRRAERHVVRLSTTETGVGDTEQLINVIVYLNSLSDYLFVVARLCNKIHGLPDTLWQK